MVGIPPGITIAVNIEILDEFVEQLDACPAVYYFAVHHFVGNDGAGTLENDARIDIGRLKLFKYGLLLHKLLKNDVLFFYDTSSFRKDNVSYFRDTSKLIKNDVSPNEDTLYLKIDDVS